MKETTPGASLPLSLATWPVKASLTAYRLRDAGDGGSLWTALARSDEVSTAGSVREISGAGKSGSHRTRRWRETDANPRSPRDRDDGFRLNSRARFLPQKNPRSEPLSLRHRVYLTIRRKE
jgi:hypothetical protein